MANQTRFRNKVENKGARGVFIYIIIPLIAIAAMIIGYTYNKLNEKQNSYAQIDYILSFMQNGVLNDFSNKIGMKDPETDIKWYLDDDTVKVEFGYMTMKFSTEEFLSDYCKNYIGQIGITSELIKTGENTSKLKLFYNGKEIERWVS